MVFAIKVILSSGNAGIQVDRASGGATGIFYHGKHGIHRYWITIILFDSPIRPSMVRILEHSIIRGSPVHTGCTIPRAAPDWSVLGTDDQRERRKRVQGFQEQ